MLLMRQNYADGAQMTGLFSIVVYFSKVLVSLATAEDGGAIDKDFYPGLWQLGLRGEITWASRDGR